MEWELATVEEAHAFNLDEYATCIEWMGDTATVYARGIGLTYRIKLPTMPQGAAQATE